jgi:SAM-dependent methyltransferase
MNSFKKALVKLDWALSSQFGIDPRRLFRSFVSLPRFLRDLSRFRASYRGAITIVPCLHDRNAAGGATVSEYFWQDLLVAQWIYAANPRRHVDIGSRVDGFVAHVASFRQIEMFDVRPISAQVPGIVFRQADLTDPRDTASDEDGYCDSLSCLHAIEHFGLGRYGDALDPAGHERGLANMARLLAPGGRFYLSTPVGRERVEFNANRVFDPETIIRCAEANGLHLEELTVISNSGKVSRMAPSREELLRLARADYNLGVFVFSKVG